MVYPPGRQKPNSRGPSKRTTPTAKRVELGARTWRVGLTQGEDGYIVAQCLELPAAISQGRTREEALANIREAIEVTLEGIERAARTDKADLVTVTV